MFPPILYTSWFKKKQKLFKPEPRHFPQPISKQFYTQQSVRLSLVFCNTNVVLGKVIFFVGSRWLSIYFVI